MTASTQSEASIAYSIPFADREYGFDLELPRNVSSYSELRQKARSESRNQELQLAGLYREIKHLLKNYDSFTEEVLEEIKKIDYNLDAQDVRESLKGMKKRNRESKKLIKTNEALFESHPSIASDLVNHHMLADTFISLAQEIDDEVGFERVLEEDSDISEDEYKLNLFLTLEPYLVVCVLRADEMGDSEFLNLYQNLFDEMSFKFSRNLPNLFDKIVNYDELKLQEDEFEEFIEDLEFEEMYD